MTSFVAPGQHIHIVGIGGAGMSAIARVLLESGVAVTGSDRQMSDVARDLHRDGATIFVGHAAENIAGASLVLATSAAKDDNPEISAAHAAGIPVMNRREFFKYLLPDKAQIAVAGTHGKTTTTAMIVHLLREAGLDPSYIVGGVMGNTGNNAHAGQGAAFVIEADEYGDMFLGLRPHIAVITNIEFDHPDIFASLDDVVVAFRRFVALLPDNGLLIACADNPLTRRLAEERRAAGKPAQTYSLRDPDANWIAFKDDIELARDLARRGPLFEVESPPGPYLAGDHNVLNALAATAAAAEMGVQPETSIKALSTFKGTGRRFEKMGDADGVLVISDYGHHPTAIRATLQAARQRYRASRIWAVWQPHTFSRTSKLASEFAAAFRDADQTLITEIYAAREKPSPGDTTVPDLVRMAEVSSSTSAYFKGARYSGSLEVTAAILLKEVAPGDVVIIFSAGDGPKVGEWLLKALRERNSPVPAIAPRTPYGYEDLHDIVGDRLRLDEPLARYTVARLGGPADALVTVNTAQELQAAFEMACQRGWLVKIIGGGANILISDLGFRGLVIINDTRSVVIEPDGTVRADSGVGLIHLTRETMARGLSGFEWAIGIPGTLGGAVVNNAGAHGDDMAGCLVEAEVLMPPDPVTKWPLDRLAYRYRESALKHPDMPFVVLSAMLKLSPGHDPVALRAKAEEYNAHRKRTQPPGASLGSMFKNPPGDYAGRLIEQAGLKGYREGGVMVSPVHANFFVNTSGGTATDYLKLIRLAQSTVYANFGVALELEVELFGEGFDRAH